MHPAEDLEEDDEEEQRMQRATEQDRAAGSSEKLEVATPLHCARIEDAGPIAASSNGSKALARATEFSAALTHKKRRRRGGEESGHEGSAWEKGESSEREIRRCAGIGETGKTGVD